MIEVQSGIGGKVESTHFALIRAHEFSFPSALHKSHEIFRQAWNHLELDPCMSDGGKYRLRRYSQFRFSADTGRLTHIPGASYFQSVEVNPLNGGKSRQFASLTADTVESRFLHELIRFDFAQLTGQKHLEDNGLIGVHQIQTLATSGIPGNPTPEGIHRDDETYTSERLIARHNIDGGINYFYGSTARPTTCPQTVWKQESYFDSHYFDRTLGHEVSPIVSGSDGGVGFFDLGMAIVGACREGSGIAFEKAKQLLLGYRKVITLRSIERETLKTFAVYAATATSFWRFRQYHLRRPEPRLYDQHVEMQSLADTISEYPDSCFMELFTEVTAPCSETEPSA